MSAGGDDDNNTVASLVLSCLALPWSFSSSLLYPTSRYTAAGFSGRMPCAELADAIVSLGRETLLRAIRLVDGNKTWGTIVRLSDSEERAQTEKKRKEKKKPRSSDRLDLVLVLLIILVTSILFPPSPHFPLPFFLDQIRRHRLPLRGVPWKKPSSSLSNRC